MTVKSTLYTNNPSAYAHQVMNRLFGEREFGDLAHPRQSVPAAEVPAELRGLVRGLVGDVAEVDQAAVRQRLWSAVDSLQREDRGLFGNGLFGIKELGGGDDVLSQREQARALRRDPAVGPVLDYIREARGED